MNDKLKEITKDIVSWDIPNRKGWKIIRDRFNEILEGKNFFVSFSRITTMNSDCETALVKFTSKNGEFPNRKFYILKGDWREQYEKLVLKGYKACKKFFDEHSEHRNFWTN